MHKPALSQWLLISLIVIVLDLYSKHLVQQAFTLGNQQTITSFFDLVRYHNEGAAFSFLADAGGWQKWFFTAVSVFASSLILYLLNKHYQERLFSLGLSLVLGGAIGNLYDRITLGYVVDFLSFHINDLYWPAFNVADSAITVGVMLLIWDSLTTKKEA